MLRDVARVTGVGLASLRLLARSLRVEQGAERDLGVDHERASGPEVDDQVGTLDALIGRADVLLREVDAVDHAGRLDEPAQVRLPPAAAHVDSPEGARERIRYARVGHVGLYRDPKTLVAVEYYFKMPPEMGERDVIVLDPMLATGNSAVAAVERLKELGPRSMKFVCLLAAPEGLATFHESHPDVPVYTAAVDRQLNEHGYILPGLGDAGDRIFGTR